LPVAFLEGEGVEKDGPTTAFIRETPGTNKKRTGYFYATGRACKYVKTPIQNSRGRGMYIKTLAREISYTHVFENLLQSILIINK
jgi:hypothetical protein